MSLVTLGGVISVSRKDFDGYFKLSMSSADTPSDAPKHAKSKIQVKESRRAMSCICVSCARTKLRLRCENTQKGIASQSQARSCHPSLHAAPKVVYPKVVLFRIVVTKPASSCTCSAHRVTWKFLLRSPQGLCQVCSVRLDEYCAPAFIHIEYQDLREKQVFIAVTDQ